jgi:hypothetical protein
MKMISILQEKLSEIVGSYSKSSTKDSNKLIQDIISLLFQEKMDKVNLGDSLSRIQTELQTQPDSKQIMEDLKSSMSQVLTNAIVNRIKR